MAQMKGKDIHPGQIKRDQTRARKIKKDLKEDTEQKIVFRAGHLQLSFLNLIHFLYQTILRNTCMNPNQQNEKMMIYVLKLKAF